MTCKISACGRNIEVAGFCQKHYVRFKKCSDMIITADDTHWTHGASGPLNPMYGKHPNLGEKNGQWKGDKVSYRTLHHWVRRHLSPIDLCPNCNVKPPYDIANISGKYLRDLKDWQWLCRSCHMKSDGRMLNLKRYKR